MALGDHCGCVLFTLDGCCHLDGLEQWRSFSTCWWLFVAAFGDYVGSCTFPVEEPQGTLLIGRFLWRLLWWARCVILLAIEPPNVGQHNGD
jgi:hypothetical protein